MGSNETGSVKIETIQPKTIIQKSDGKLLERLAIGTATLGTIRIEWHQARIGQIIPVNWSMVTVMETMGGYVPLGYLVADAQNLIVKHAIEGNFDWLLLYEDDVLPPADAYIRINQYMIEEDVPVVSGLYYAKSMPPEPLAFRGRGNGVYIDWEVGDKVWVDGVPTGFLLIHMSIIREMWKDAEPYDVRGVPTRRMFNFPRDTWRDPETGHFQTKVGTSDLEWCTRVMEGGYFEKAGWPEYQEKDYPFLLDTNIFCRHINPNGEMYP